MYLQITEDAGVWILSIHRESALNALNEEVLHELSQAVDRASVEAACQGIIITGAGTKAFAAGADIAAFKGLDSKAGTELAVSGQALFDKIEKLPKPVIAAVNGFALGGGCELAMACHLRVAASHAQFGQPEVKLGLIPGYGGTQRLVQYIGRTKAMELLMTGEMISAAEALQLGLVNQVVDSGQEVEAAKALLKKILSRAPLAIAKVIECVNNFRKAEVNGFDYEAQAFGQLIASHDAKEGIEAFLQKRKPNFQGR